MYLAPHSHKMAAEAPGILSAEEGAGKGRGQQSLSPVPRNFRPLRACWPELGAVPRLKNNPSQRHCQERFGPNLKSTPRAGHMAASLKNMRSASSAFLGRQPEDSHKLTVSLCVSVIKSSLHKGQLWRRLLGDFSPKALGAATRRHHGRKSHGASPF